MSYTLNEAAKAVGKSKTTIHRAIKSGKISASKLESGAYAIDPSELHRVFHNGTGERIKRNDAEQPKSTSGTTDIRLEILEKERERERQQLEETIADLREDRDKWRQQATALLEDKRPKGFWARIRGK